MAKIPAPRTGKEVSIKGKALPFSYWPMYKSSRRYGLHSRLYVTNPWAVIEGSIKSRCPANSRAEALASARQAEQFFKASREAQLWASKPLLTYYSFLNLAKAYALTQKLRQTYDKAQHGLSENLTLGGQELVNSVLTAYQSPNRNGVAQGFSEFLQAISGTGIAQEVKFDLKALLPQIVTGHRLWCDAADKGERFVAIDSIDLMQDKQQKTLWVDFRIGEDGFSGLGITHSALLTESRLQQGWADVQGSADPRNPNRWLVRFQQKTVLTYSARPSDEIPNLIKGVRPYIWSTVTTFQPFRKYYLYFCPVAEHAQVLPQLVSIYAVFYYLGSVTRYRPQQFDMLLNGSFGEQLQELLTNIPNQFLYLMASEFAQREVTRAAIV
jgi:hypothetical protein